METKTKNKSIGSNRPIAVENSKVGNDARLGVGGVSIGCSAVTHKFENQKILFENLDIKIEHGSILSLLGPSGCGKSTLLRILSGLENPTSGIVNLRRKPLPGNIGFVFQDPTLLPWRTVTENVAIPLEIMGAAGEESEEKVKYWLEQVGFIGSGELLPSQLSGGMKMRVSLARALITEPEVIFLDEPFSALDELSRWSMQKLLVGIWERHPTTIVFVTHSPQEAVFVSQRLLVFGGQNPSKIVSDLPIRFDQHRNDDLRYTNEYSQLVRAVQDQVHRGNK